MTANCALLVLTCNEEKNLQHCLDSVQGLVREIYVVDSGSTDRTIEIARRFTDNVVQHEFTTQADQFNWALDHLPIESDWVLRLDADEFLLPELRDEISRVLPGLSEDVTGLLMKRRVYFKGRWIRYGGYYPTWLLRLFRRGAGRSESIAMDEHLIVIWGRTARLQHDFVDYNRKSLAFWTAKHMGYAAREASMLMAEELSSNDKLSGQAARKRWLKGNVYNRAPLFLRPFAYFTYRYVLRRGFLDGTEGLMFHFFQACWYRFYVDAYVWEARGERASASRE